ncbi:13959_t:CDS:2, partial [Acaulospora colombiana]
IGWEGSSQKPRTRWPSSGDTQAHGFSLRKYSLFGHAGATRQFYTRAKPSQHAGCRISYGTAL